MKYSIQFNKISTALTSDDSRHPEVAPDVRQGAVRLRRGLELVPHGAPGLQQQENGAMSSLLSIGLGHLNKKMLGKL